MYLVNQQRNKMGGEEISMKKKRQEGQKKGCKNIGQIAKSTTVDIDPSISVNILSTSVERQNLLN